VAVVGSRRHTGYGADAATAIAGGASRAGVVVVSGLARGIDAAAHAAALEGGTIAVLGCGVDVEYPRENARLQARIAGEGLLLSEFAPGTPALPFHFPRRNRIIAALARGVVVVEATAKSGSLITVDHALDLGRDVFAVPGPIGSDTSAGTNALIRDGARLVESAEQLLEELGLLPEQPILPPPPPAPLAGEAGIAGALSREPRHLDELAAVCGVTPAGALVALLELELAGKARQLAGARFVRAG
jgi:DNA processing protein